MSYIGNTPSQQSFTPAIDYFNGNGSTVAFTLSRPVASVAQVQVTISNVPQNPGSAYTVSGNTITFTSAPPSGTSNIYVYYTSPITQVIQPGQGTVGTVQIADNAITTSKIAAGSVVPADLSTGGLYWDSAGNVGIGTSSPAQKLEVNVNGGNSAQAYALIAAGGSNKANQKFGVAFDDPAVMSIYGTYDGNSVRRNEIRYATSVHLFGSSGFASEYMRIDSSGNVGIGTSSSLASTKLSVVGSINGMAIQCANGSVGSYMTNTSGTGNWTPISFNNNGTSFSQIGSIATTSVSTLYNTTSDYRLKEALAPMQGALARVAALKPVTYKWKVDGSDGEGFIAHELQAVVPDCVTGEKDAVDSDGNPKYQGIDTSFLVATLTAAIQEQQAQIEQLKADVAALKGAV